MESPRLFNVWRDKSGFPSVFPTCLGRSTFGNPDQWIPFSIHRAAQAYSLSLLEVVLVRYGRPDKENRRLLQDCG
jgi:hypothetical protein